MNQKFAICNEVFGNVADMAQWQDVCRFVAGCGYAGIEIAPFTFASSVEEVTPGQRQEIARIAADAGLDIVGLHWLLAAPPGLHIHTRDNAVRLRTVDYMLALIDFAGDVGAPVMIFGSPRQRSLEDEDAKGAWRRTQWSYQALLPQLQARQVFLCQESLPAPENDFIQTVEEAQRMVAEIDHPNFRLMLDVKSMSAQSEPLVELIRQYGRQSVHFHANDANRRAPGYGDTDFGPIAAALRDCAYRGYVSLEPFDYSPDPHTLARESLQYLKRMFEV